MVSPSLAQVTGDEDGTFNLNGNPDTECTKVAQVANLSNLVPFAKYENENSGGFVSDLDGDGDNITFDPSPPTVPDGSWSSNVPIKAFLIKQATFVDYWIVPDPGTALDYDSGDDEYSHMTFCISKDYECDTPNLAGEDVVDEGNRTVSNTIRDQEGITEFTFTTLDNFTVVDNFNSGYTRSGNLDQPGVKWTWEGSGFPPTEVSFTLQAGPDGSATYFLKVTDACPDPPKTTTFDPTYELTPISTQLQFKGNSPNPFGEHTQVEFSLPSQMDVTLSVYDIMGRKVATLVDGRKATGTHMVSWNGRSSSGRELASGVYLMRLQAGDQVTTRRLTIVR